MLTALAAAFALQTAPSVDLDDLSWMVGCWEGTGFGSPVMECWMRGPTGTLTGMFQMLDDTGEQRFSEIFVIAVYEDGAALRLKHFDRDMTGWEAQDEYVEFRLIETGDGFGRFEGLDYRLDEDGRMIVDLVVGTADGSRVEQFVYTRVR